MFEDVFRATQSVAAPASPEVGSGASPTVAAERPSAGALAAGAPAAATGPGLTPFSQLLDLPGRIDRARAAQELASKFCIIDDDKPGEGLPNEVTAAEYEQIVRNYSDIRLGRTDLVIDGGTSQDPDAFKADMMDDIGDIMQTESGRELVGELAHNTRTVGGKEIHRQVRLMPSMLDGEPDTTGAITATMAYPGLGAPDEHGKPGTGEDTWTQITPNHDVGMSGGPVIRSDVALYHEMVHALHDTHGTLDAGSVEASDVGPIDATRGLLGIVDQLAAYDGVLEDASLGTRAKEHQATGLGRHAGDRFTENVYRAERRRVARSGKGLRGDASMAQRDRYTKFMGSYLDGIED
ncbi:MAG: hypothetical protein KC464_26885 [Myxococcales bacterium]|nr:hypothetical protein [Myxococcales bacterium]